MLSFRRKFLKLMAMIFVASLPGLATAAPQPWDEKAFLAAQAAGKPILIDVYASW